MPCFMDVGQSQENWGNGQNLQNFFPFPLYLAPYCATYRLSIPSQILIP